MHIYFIFIATMSRVDYSFQLTHFDIDTNAAVTTDDGDHATVYRFTDEGMHRIKPEKQFILLLCWIATEGI